MSPTSSRARTRLRPLVALLVVCLASPALGIARASASVDDGPTLRQLAERSGVLIGSGAIRASYLEDPRFQTTLAEQFGSLSPDNDLKFSEIEPERGVYRFDRIDPLIEFADEHGMEVKGHGLISGSFNPSWLTDPANTADQVREWTQDHFDTVMTRYPGRIDRWDVATEVLSTFGGTGLAANFWYEKLGPGYLDEVFWMAHDADPGATLFLNESLVESYPAKAAELYELVSGMVERGVPIHGVGLEMHATIVGPPPGALTAIVESYRALGLEVAVTEADAHVTDEALAQYGLPGTADEVQGQIYGAIVAEALAAGVTDISFWGFSDAVQTYTWLPGARPTMFDEQYQPKPAYFATRSALYAHADDEAPTVTLSGPEDGATYVQGASVLAAYTCADEWGAWSLASCDGSLPPGTALDTSTIGPAVFSVTATDANGNTTTVSATYDVVAAGTPAGPSIPGAARPAVASPRFTG